MICFPFPILSKPEFMVRRLRDLGRHLAEVSSRVRQAVVDAIRATMADITGDAVDHLLLRRLSKAATPEPHQSYEPREEYDPWADEQDPYRCYQEEDVVESVPVPACEPVPTPPKGPRALTVGVTAASWWLRQQGSLLGAFGIAVVATAAAALTNTFDSLPLVEAAGELWNLQRCLSACVAFLTRS
jgi:hypothetical protein